MANVSIYDGDAVREFKGVNLHDSLKCYYGKFPSNAILYKDQCAIGSEVDISTIEAINDIDADNGDYFVITGFGDPITVILVVAAVVSVSTAVFSLLNQPSLPGLDNSQTGSSNNLLSGRRNRLRPNARIPDIFGRVRSIPDLISLPLRTFANNREVETALMCVGRGSYQVDEIRDGTTLVVDIDGASAEVYAPFTSPNSGDEPQVSVGPQIFEGVTNNRQLRSVNGQPLIAPNATTESTSLTNATVNFTHNSFGQGILFQFSVSNQIDVGDIVTVASQPAQVFFGGFLSGAPGAIVDLSGTYTVSLVINNQIYFDDPESVNPDWALLPINARTNLVPASVSQGTSVRVRPNIIGPFETRLSGADQWICNFIAPNGVFQIDNDGQAARSVNVLVRITPIDAAGVATGTAETFTTTIRGSNDERGRIGVTLICRPSFTGFARIEAERTTDSDFDFEGTISDEILWRDVFFTAPVEQEHFGNVTLIQSRTVATEQAAAIADREINLIVTREVPLRIGQTNTFTAPAPTRRADNIMIAIALDPYIGRMKLTDIDVDSIFTSVQVLEDYYGAEEAVEFNITLDNDNQSLQETFNIMNNVLSLQPYRVGRVLKAFPVIATDRSAMVFNHRNKRPDTDIIRDGFGSRLDIDGARLQYIDSRDFLPRQFNIPEDETAQSPRTVSGLGSANALQSYHMIWRARNTDLYQVGSHEFEAMPEAQLLIRGQNILVADNTRSEMFDGEITAINGLVLTLSRDPQLQAGTDYAITIGHKNMTAETIPIASSVGNQVTLSRPLGTPLFIEADGVFCPPYVITGEDNSFVRTCRTLTTTPDTSGMTRVETAVYTPLVHSNDAITLWLRDGLEDFGPFIFSPNAFDVNQRQDPIRGTVLFFDENGDLTPNINQTDGYSFLAWVRSGLTADVVVKNTPDGFVQINANGTVTFSHGGITIISDPIVSAPNEWVQVACVYNNNTQTYDAYVNGALVGSDTSPSADAGVIRLGGGAEFRLDDVRLYRRAMTADEITALFQATRL